LRRLIVERQNFNGFFARNRAVDRPEMITGTTGQQQSHRGNGEELEQAHFSWPALQGAA